MKIFPLIFIICFFNINKAEETLQTYDKLNNLEIISNNQSFMIKTSVKSIAYFDSFDKNSIVYITQDKNKFDNKQDEKITGQFYTIEPDTDYYVRNHLYFYTSTFKKYLYPLNLNEKEIKIAEENINFLYLEKNKIYTLDFEGNTIKKMIKLSRKTLNTKITVENNVNENTYILDQISLYYKLDDDFKGKLKLTVEGNDAFIEFLSDTENYEIIEEVSKTNYTMKNDTTIIKIQNTQKDFYIQLHSDKPFDYSFSYGFTDNQNYYYYPSTTKVPSEHQNNYYIALFKLFTPFKDISLVKNEFLSFAVNIEKKSEGQKVILSYYQFSELDLLLEEKMEKKDCEEIIKYLKKIFNIYVFTDIAKNPPNIEIEGIENYHHKKIDIQLEFDNIKTENRTFYEFYQEIMKIITATKDYHISIYSIKTPKGIEFGEYVAVLPFNFVIKEYNKENKKEFRLFIEKNRFFNNFDEPEKKFIENHLNIPLKSINDINPFDYIQNWSKFRQTKNLHAQFTKVITSVSGFYFSTYPFNYSDVNLNEYEFEDNQLLRIPYFIGVPEPQNVEFHSYFSNYVQNIGMDKEIPLIDKIKDQFLISKGLKKNEPLKEVKKEIKWDIDYKEDDSYLKCRVDETKKVNVLAQNSFSFDYLKAMGIIFQCADLFHTNEYPLIIIESNNGGGIAQIYMMLHQLLQIRTVDRSYFSYRISDEAREFFKDHMWDGNDVDTCEVINSYDNFTEVIDHYNYNGLNIEHRRGKSFDLLAYYFRNAVKEFRIKYKDSKYLKKPTDIIIFTDSYSYSATCGFIKGFQNTGGAIIAGYFGNPKIEGIKQFDASQSISSVVQFRGTEIYDHLYKLGILASQVTVGESFDDSYQGENPIPREYQFDPIDTRVNIYSRYSDDIYDKFIDEGLNIHKQFNEDKTCNPKNDKLLLHSDNCKNIEGKEHAHGGYKCNEQTNKWDDNDIKNCQPYYCDYGYYYDQYRKECVEYCNFNDSKTYTYYYNVTHIQLDLKNDISYTFLFLNPSYNNYYYFFKASKDIGYTKIGFLNNDGIIIDKEENKDGTYKFEIEGITSDIYFRHLYGQKINLDSITFNIYGKMMYLIESKVEHIIYYEPMFNIQFNKLKIATYKDSMNSQDILNINEKYFSVFSGNFYTLPKDQLTLFSFDYQNLEQVHIYISPKSIPKDIEIIDKQTNFLYLEKNNVYTLNFQNNTINRMIKLSRKSVKSEIIIENLEDEKNVTLNSDNLYYKIKENYTGELKLYVKNDDALIEFLFKQDNVNIIELKTTESKSNSKYNLIKVPKEYKNQRVYVIIQSNNNMTMALYFGYCIPPYSYYFYRETENGFFLGKGTTLGLDHLYGDDIKLMNDEYYCILLESLDSYRDLRVSILGNNNDSNDSDKEKGLETWAIILIVVASLILVLLIVVLIIFCIKRSKLKSSEIEEKIEKLNEIQELEKNA